MAKSAGAKIYLIDIETSPSLGWSWGKYEQNILRFKREWELLSFSFKRHGERKTTCYARPQFRDRTDYKITKAAWDILNDADVLVGHNIDGFDNPKLRAKFVEHGLPPPKTYKTIDTLKIARSQFLFNSNKLDDLAKTLRIGRKVKTGGVDLWFDCMAGCKKAWKKMIAYNKQDVVLLERVYNLFRTWLPTHPNLSVYKDRPGCPVCTSRKVQQRGFNVARVRKTPRYHCQDCGHWFTALAKRAA